MAVEFWTSGRGRARSEDPSVFDSAKQAKRAEELGYDGITFVDSQNRASDCYVALTVAAHATTRLKLGTGVTNSYTRHPAVTASAIAAIQAESRGRAYLGIGRGDSALAHLGRAPHAVPAFERYLEQLQGYLRGDEVAFGDSDVDVLGLADTPEASRIEWLDSSYTKVPVDVAATGPRVIAAAARHADQVSLAVGGDPERIKWGMEVAREARDKAGLDSEIAFGAYIPTVVHDDPEVALSIGSAGLSLFARFSNMYGEIVGPVTDSQTRSADQDSRQLRHAPTCASGQQAVRTGDPGVRQHVRYLRRARLLRPTPGRIDRAGRHEILHRRHDAGSEQPLRRVQRALRRRSRPTAQTLNRLRLVSVWAQSRTRTTSVPLTPSSVAHARCCVEEIQ